MLAAARPRRARGARAAGAAGAPGLADGRPRSTSDGAPVLLEAQDRTRWDQLLIRRGLAALQRAEQLAARGTPVGTLLPAGLDRRPARPRAARRGHRLAPDRGAVRRPGRRRARAGRRGQPGRRPRPGVRPGRRAGRARRAGRRRARRLAARAERARRPARAGRAARAGGRGVHRGGRAHQERGRARRPAAPGRSRTSPAVHSPGDQRSPGRLPAASTPGATSWPSPRVVAWAATT